jgi:hypothetical protein
MMMSRRREASVPVPVEVPEMGDDDKLVYVKLRHGRNSLRRRTEGDVLKVKVRPSHHHDMAIPAPFAAAMARNANPTQDENPSTDLDPPSQSQAVVNTPATVMTAPPTVKAGKTLRSNSLQVSSQKPAASFSVNSVVMKSADSVKASQESVSTQKLHETTKLASSAKSSVSSDDVSAQPAGMARSNSDTAQESSVTVVDEQKQWAVSRQLPSQVKAVLTDSLPERAQSLPGQLDELGMIRGGRRSSKVINDIKSVGRQRLLSIAADNTMKLREKTETAQLMAEERARRLREQKEEKRLRLLLLLKERGQLPPDDDVIVDQSRAASTSHPSLSRDYQDIDEVQMLRMALLHLKLTEGASTSQGQGHA